MRCGPCELDQKKPARFCECCGKEISQHQAKASEAIDTDWAPKRSAWDLRCPKCGGPSLDGGVCQVCQKPTPPVDRGDSSSTPRHSEAPAASPHPQPAGPTVAMPSRPQMTAPYQGAMHAAPAPPREMPPPPLSEVPTIPVARERTPTPLPRRPQTEASTPDRSHRPPVAAARRPSVQQKKKPSQAYSFALIAASVVIVAALGAAADWLFVRQDSTVTRSAQASMPAITENPAAPPASQPAADSAPAVDDRPASRDAIADALATAPARTPAPAAAVKDAAPSKPRPAAPARPAKAAAVPTAKTAHPQTASREVAAVPAPALTASAAPAPAPVPPVRESAPAPVPEKAAPVGPFFETKDVSESPRVTARVEPRLPAELRARKVHEILIVRALVSQSGHPSRVSVLRKSKVGPQLDDVVVAAVNQWTFSPAKKKGEPVSCWFNFGVTVGAAD